MSETEGPTQSEPQRATGGRDTHDRATLSVAFLVFATTLIYTWFEFGQLNQMRNQTTLQRDALKDSREGAAQGQKNLDNQLVETRRFAAAAESSAKTAKQALEETKREVAESERITREQLRVSNRTAEAANLNAELTRHTFEQTVSPHISVQIPYAEYKWNPAIKSYFMYGSSSATNNASGEANIIDVAIGFCFEPSPRLRDVEWEPMAETRYSNLPRRILQGHRTMDIFFENLSRILRSATPEHMLKAHYPAILAIRVRYKSELGDEYELVSSKKSKPVWIAPWPDGVTRPGLIFEQFAGPDFNFVRRWGNQKKRSP